MDCVEGVSFAAIATNTVGDDVAFTLWLALSCLKRVVVSVPVYLVAKPGAVNRHRPVVVHEVRLTLEEIHAFSALGE